LGLPLELQLDAQGATQRLQALDRNVHVLEPM
jgi:hypothetical protein